MLESKTFGILSLLDEECRMPTPQTASFMHKVISAHTKCNAFSLCPPKQIRLHRGSNNLNGFVIQHFGHKVEYTTVMKYLYVLILIWRRPFYQPFHLSSYLCNKWSFYSQDDFIEKNAEVFPKSLKNLADKAMESLHLQCSILATKLNTKHASGNKQSTFSMKIRSDLNMLVSSLKSTVRGFVVEMLSLRCLCIFWIFMIMIDLILLIFNFRGRISFVV